MTLCIFECLLTSSMRAFVMHSIVHTSDHTQKYACVNRNSCIFLHAAVDTSMSICFFAHSFLSASIDGKTLKQTCVDILVHQRYFVYACISYNTQVSMSACKSAFTYKRRCKLAYMCTNNLINMSVRMHRSQSTPQGRSPICVYYGISMSSNYYDTVSALLPLCGYICLLQLLRFQEIGAASGEFISHTI